MPNAAFFTRMGLFVREDFLDAETCERLRQEARSAPSLPGRVINQPGQPGLLDVDLEGRRVRHTIRDCMPLVCLVSGLTDRS